MYLHIGNGETVKKKDIIGIFDMDTATVSQSSRSFLSGMQKNNNVLYLGSDIPRSFILTQEKKGKYKTYLSKISAVGLKARINNDYNEEKTTIN